MQKVVGSNPISRLPRLVRPAGRTPSGRFLFRNRGSTSVWCVRYVVPAVLLMVLVAVGCGGGSTKTETESDTQREVGPPSKADYIQVADVICRNHQSRREDLESQTIDLGRIDTRAKARRVAVLLRQESENLTAEIGELGTRPPPPSDAGKVGSVLALVRAKAHLIDSWAKAYDDLDMAEIQRLQIRIGLATARARDRARAYGFEVCGQD
jgi:hypothetical protein